MFGRWVIAACLLAGLSAPVGAQERFTDDEMTVIELHSTTGIKTHLSPTDIDMMAASRQRALETYGDGQELSWYNAETGHAGSVSAEPADSNEKVMGDTACRAIRERVLIDGVVYEAPGIYCRLAYAAWVNRTPFTREFAQRTPASATKTR